MNIEIITKNLQFDIYGFGSIATSKDYSRTAFMLSGKMWDVVKAHSLKNKGRNIWVYETSNRVFAGVELENPSDYNKHGLEEMKINVEKYAYHKHIGSYNLIKQAGQNMTTQLNKQGYVVTLPYIEIYGHWTSDESKLETELFMCLK